MLLQINRQIKYFRNYECFYNCFVQCILQHMKIPFECSDGISKGTENGVITRQYVSNECGVSSRFCSTLLSLSSVSLIDFTEAIMGGNVPHRSTKK